MKKYYTVEINKQSSYISVATFLGNYESISEAKEAAFPKMYDEDLLIGFDMDKEPEFTDNFGFHTVDMSLAHEDEIVVLKRTDSSLEDIPEDLFYWSDDVQDTTYYKADGSVWEPLEMSNDNVQKTSVTRSWKVYGLEGHRQRESFCKSYSYDFSKENDIRIIEVLNSDITGTNEYSIIKITRNTAKECEEELSGQLSDGIFENSRTGKIEEIVEDLFLNEKCKEIKELEEPDNQISNSYIYAEKGKHFVLTQKGYDATPDHIKQERKIGEPVFEFYKTKVPASWMKKGYVEEVPYKLNNIEKIKQGSPSKKKMKEDYER